MFDRHYAVWPKGVPKHLTLPQTSLYENIEISARRFPNKPALRIESATPKQMKDSFLPLLLETAEGLRDQVV